MWGRWNGWWDRRNPWMRYRMARILKFFVWGTIIVFVLASYWGLTFWEAIAQMPRRMIFNPFTNGQMPWFFSLIFLMGTILLQFVAMFWFLGRGGIETYMPEDIKTRFTDVWGQDHVLTKVKENIVFLDRPKEIEDKGGYVPSGILLWGPPGTGKTLMAEAVAGETGKPFVFVEPGAFIQMFFGIGVMKVRRLFKKLRKLALKHGGVIVFFDEADTLGNRGGAVAGGFRVDGTDEARAYDSLFAGACNGSHFLSTGARRVLHDDVVASLAAGRTDDSAAAPPARPVRRRARRRRHGRHGRLAPGDPHRDVRPQQAARLLQPRRARLPVHPAEEAAEVPHPHDHGDEHAAVARRRAAAPGPHRPHVPRRTTRTSTAGAAPSRATSPRCATCSRPSRSRAWRSCRRTRRAP